MECCSKVWHSRACTDRIPHVCTAALMNSTYCCLLCLKWYSYVPNNSVVFFKKMCAKGQVNPKMLLTMFYAEINYTEQKHKSNSCITKMRLLMRMDCVCDVTRMWCSGYVRNYDPCVGPHLISLFGTSLVLDPRSQVHVEAAPTRNTHRVHKKTFFFFLKQLCRCKYDCEWSTPNQSLHAARSAYLDFENA